ncbi:hypothetical protein AAFF_G00062210 [Aldrovandia affinis]|uniref:Transposase n=1 Tax=Aldrovandia affinis TaxID=143900 RepID=A0AAD7S008_9TELE|nr:hypothetical protein AAFF_G00062210 [Aldrovandia affinis]
MHYHLWKVRVFCPTCGKQLKGYGVHKRVCKILDIDSNETDQVLISVLTAQEGPGLDLTVADVMKRYSQAAVASPVLLYVDCRCCVEMGVSKLQDRFGEWTNLNIRLDIWHFMQQLAEGCTTDTHSLYPTFMGCLSVCIFEWDPQDVALLCQMKRQELRQEGVPLIRDVLWTSTSLRKSWPSTADGGLMGKSPPSALLSFHCHLNRLIAGEMIGVDYLLRQPGQPLQNVDPDSEETSEMLEDLGKTEVGNIVALWQNLLDYDKQRVVFAARHQDRLNTGRQTEHSSDLRRRRQSSLQVCRA